MLTLSQKYNAEFWLNFPSCLDVSQCQLERRRRKFCSSCYVALRCIAFCIHFDTDVFNRFIRIHSFPFNTTRYWKEFLEFLLQMAHTCWHIPCHFFCCSVFNESSFFLLLPYYYSTTYFYMFSIEFLE